MSLLERLTALLAPDSCLQCDREGSLLCVACQPLLPAPSGRCFGCLRSVGAPACADCLHDRCLQQVQATTAYESTPRALVASLKFHGNQSAARIIAQIMAPALTAASNRTLLVHVPATNEHIRQRGFDQSALISRELSRLTGLEHATAFIRHGRHHQLGGNRQQRLAQPELLAKQSVRGRHIVLIDDVLTTGATISAATQALLEAGAKSVEALIFAQADKK